MEITYCSTYRDLCRCTLYGMTRRRELLIRLAIPIVYGAFVLGRDFKQTGWIAFPIAAVASALSLLVILTFIIQVLVLSRLLIPSARRRCTTTLTSEGFTDMTLRKTQSIPWLLVSDIRYHQGDIYFWRKGKDGIFVPQSAFRNSQQSQEFYQCALSFWNTAKEGRAVAPLWNETAWPPAPRPGA